MSDLLLGSQSSTNVDITTSNNTNYTLNYLGDIQFDATGQLIQIQNTDLLVQAIGKIFLTLQGSSNIDPLYGSAIQSFSNLSGNLDTIYALLKQAILQTLSYNIQEYSTSTNGNEQIAVLNSIQVQVDPLDPTAINVVLTVTTAAQQQIPISLTLGGSSLGLS